MSRHPHLFLALLLTLLLGIPTLALPAFRDQAIFALIGDLIRQGDFPYRDAVDFKPPGIHYLYAVGGLLSGRELWGPRLLDLIAIGCGVAALHHLLLPVGRLGAGIGAALFGTAYLGGFGYAELAQPEGFLISTVLAARAIASRPSARAWAVAGMLIGVATLLKYTAIGFLLLFLFAPGNRARWTALVAGSLAVVGTMAATLVAGGAWDAFRTIQTEYLPGYSALVGRDGAGAAIRGSGPLAGRFLAERPVVWIGVLAGLLALLTPTARRSMREPVVGLLIGVAGLLAQGKFFFYHWIPIVPFALWLGTVGVTALGERVRTRRRLVWSVAGAVGVAAALATALPRTTERLAAIRYLTGGISRGEFYETEAFGRWGEGDHATIGSFRLAEAIEARCPPGETVFIWGFEPFAYLASGRAPASRFIYNAPFLSPWCPEAWKRELIETLLEHPPRLIVLASHDAIPWVTGVPIDSRAALQSYPELRTLLRERYEPVEEVERFILLTRTG